ncbi:Tfc7p [Saccharomyces cerevisiae x Saccharomyces kudriavzevii VIN7]|uniref:Tfc7p n=1 Tax=Saccharomyces cerevisiae x Saccharomyces kudriavzevii (strain VIN7) TaxID=1095631 RepID=H0H148_SACCK|nr:Tfc7p [Saccharomyces cerevisiae x Saccharomyces kudriavzevii VIN7]
MVVSTIYIARHGYRSNWLPEGPYPDPLTGIDSDVPLAEHGVHQAKELAHYLLSLDNQPEVVFSSPFYRCLQTTQPIARLLEIPVYLERGIGEWYRPDRKPVIPVPAGYDILSKYFPGVIGPEWESTLVPNEKGETEQEMYTRCKVFWNLFIEKVEKEYPNVECILLVTHAASKIALGMSLLGYANPRMSLNENGVKIRSGSCSLDKYEVLRKSFDIIEEASDQDRAALNYIPFKDRKWVLTMNGNTEFLSSGEEMNWNFDCVAEAGSDADIKRRQETKKTSSPVPEADEQPELETVYISVDIPSGSYKDRTEIAKSAILQYSGLETDAPLFRIGNRLYEGSWERLVGTELAFPNAAHIHKKTASLLPSAESDKKISGGQSTELSATNDSGPRKLENDAEILNLTNDDEHHLEDKEKLQSEKIYRIKERIILSNVRPM